MKVCTMEKTKHGNPPLKNISCNRISIRLYGHLRFVLMRAGFRFLLWAYFFFNWMRWSPFFFPDSIPSSEENLYPSPSHPGHSSQDNCSALNFDQAIILFRGERKSLPGSKGMRDSFLVDHRKCAGWFPSGDRLQGVDVPAYEADFLVTGCAGRSM